MNKEKLSDWIQIVGLFAVFSSLLFVGFEIRQSKFLASNPFVDSYVELPFNSVPKFGPIPCQLPTVRGSQNPVYPAFLASAFDCGFNRSTQHIG